MARNKERAMEQEMAAAGAHMVRHVHTFDVILFIVLTLLALVIVYPFYNTILVSIVPQVDYTRQPFMLIPKRITWENYDFVFDSPLLLRSLGNSVILAIVGTIGGCIVLHDRHEERMAALGYQEELLPGNSSRFWRKIQRDQPATTNIPFRYPQQEAVPVPLITCPESITNYIMLTGTDEMEVVGGK